MEEQIRNTHECYVTYDGILLYDSMENLKADVKKIKLNKHEGNYF